MKIDRNKLKKSTTDVPPDCRPLIERLKSATEETLPTELSVLKTWTYGKCELYHWADVLDRFDEVLEKGCKKETDKSWTLACDLPGNTGLKELLLQVLHFTSVLIEHSFSRHLYNSMEHLTCILSSCDMTIVLEVLNLLFVFSKRSNFISRLGNDKKQGLIRRLTHLAESWGGKDNGFGLAECCQDLPVSIFPSSSTTLHFEFYVENHDDKVSRKGAANFLTCIHMENLDQSTMLASEIMEELVAKFKIPPEKQTLLYTHIRLAKLFSRHESRTQCVQARLQSIAILVYCNAIQENISSLLYPGFIEELVDIVELADPDQKLVEIKGAALRTLTSIIHLERNPKLNNIIDATGAASYHGFLPVLVRNCIQHMTDAELKPFPLPYSTALFSFLYHLASYENGVEALVSCGMMESLLQVINWYGEGQDHITFATRAVRVVDLITNLDMAAFQSQGGLNAFINRLEHEVGICKVEQPFEIRLSRLDSSMDSQPESPPLAMETDTAASPEGPVKDGEGGAKEGEAGASTTPATEPTPSTSAADGNNLQPLPNYSAAKTGRQCFPQRAALLKSMLNFLKKAIPDPSFSDSMRHLMEGSLPKSLKHVISNAEYYGPSLFLLATDVVTVYVFQEPSLLSSLQDNGLTNVVLHALLIKDVPATREVLASLPNVFSALCLNARGLEAFVLCRPFDRLFKVLLSPDYLPAMRRRRSADPFGDTASNLGNAMDELMRHQPSLRTDATKAIIKLLQEVCGMGRDKKYICQKAQPKSEQLMMSLRSPQPADGGSSDEDDEDEDITTETPTESQDSESKTSLQPDTAQSTQSETPADKQAIPLMDYVLNGMKFVEAILSNNSTDDHCKEFVTQAGLKPLMGILGLPNLPIDFPTSPACQAVASVCKAILTLSREPHVLKEGLEHLNEVLQGLAPLHQPLEAPGGSVLLRELANVAHIPDATLSPTATPLLHTLASAHAYIMMFVHVCRMGQTDIRTISVSHWGSELGLQVLEGLSKLYTSLVWESTVLLALCSEDILPPGSDFGKCDMDKLLPRDFKHDRDAPREEEAGLTRAAGELGSNGVSHAMESLSTSDTPVHMDVEQPVAATDKDGKKSKLSPALQAQVKQLKPLLSVSSRLGRALAELFGLLVKLSVGTRVRQRGVQMIPTVPITPTPAAQAVAKALTKLLADGLQWQPPAYSPVPKLRLTFLVCSVGFTSPMLFDDKKQPYHLMLQKFVASGGQEALFQAFSWALSIDGKVPLTDGLEDPQLPGGTGEFLDAWLMLIEKMVNPRAVLDSPHYLLQHSTQPDFVPFKPTQYIISTQKAAFNAVMNLWTKKPLKVYGGRMSESILAILCHIIKGEGIIRENLAKEKGDTNASSSAAGPTAGPSTAAVPGIGTAAAPTAAVPGRPPINYAHVQQLMEMGFSLTRCVEALRLTNSLEEATDHLLTTGDTGQPPIAGLDMDLSEEAQMMQAIAMSLGQNMETQDESEEKVAAGEKKKVEEEEKEKQNSEEPLDKSVLDDFTANLFPGCLALMDTLPETVYRVCELLTVVTARNGIAWQTQVLSMLVQEVQSLAKSILSIKTLTQWSEPAAQNKASQFATRIHLFSLLFEETMIPCAEALDTNSLADLLVQVMAACKDYLVAVEQAPTPKWLGPLLLLLDLYEKVSVISKRRISAEKTLANCHTWKWFDDTSGRWCKYNVGNNKTIDDAYQAGETSVRFTAGRRRYTVHFSSMVQVNEETSNRRPIMLCYAQAGDDKPQNKESNTAPPQPSPAPDTKMETDPAVPSSSDASKDHVIVSGLNSEHVSSIIRSIVGLIGVPVEAETLHAALRLVLRLTRQHQYALLFAELGGPTLLLNLTQASAFQGFLSLTMLIFRHILDEPASLKYCMEKVIKGTCSGSGSSLTGVSQRSVGAKEMHYVLRVLGPAACREPALFAELAMDIMRIALPPPSKREDDESRLTGPNAPQILKCVPTKLMAITAVHSPLKEVVESLLNALVVKYAWKADEGSGGSADGKPQTLAEAIAEVVSELTDRQTEMMRQNSTAEIPAVEDDAAATNVQASAGTSSLKDTTKDKDIKSAEDARKQRPLLPKSAILRLLSEIIKSYCSCTQLITQHVYQAGQSELITEDCSVLAFVLDYLLHANSNAGDRDCPALSRVFVASIASCNHSPDAQMTLVSEVKAALQRALALPESSEKHSHVQSLTGIISTVIESCPTPGQIPNQVFKGQQHIMNNIVKNLLKRGVVTDLARIPYSLDLSSPYMANTINSSLKPLETLSRSVNQPVQSVTAKPKPKSDNDLAVENVESNVTEPAGEDVSVVLAEEGEINLDEVHIEDISDTTGDLAHLEEVHHLEGEEPPAMVASDLDQVLEHLLQHCDTDDREIQVLDELIMETEASDARAGEDEAADLIVDVEIEEGEIDDTHDSQMISQLISEGEDDDIDHTPNIAAHVDDEDTADSASDADDDDNDDGEDDDDDDQDDDEDNEDEDDEGSDMEGDNEDMQDVDDNFDDLFGRPFNNDTFVIHADEMFQPGANQHVVFNALDNGTVRTYQMPLSVPISDADSGPDSTVPNVPPAPSTVSATHPLLVRQPDAANMMGITRVQRGRPRGTCRFNPSTQTLQVNFPRQPNPPVILQRLLGPTTASDVLQLTNSLSTQAGPPHTRVVLSNNDMRIVSRPDNDILEELFQDTYNDGPSLGMGALSAVPTTLSRWSEEAKVLDGDSIHDCMAAMKPQIVELLEKYRDEELAERREKRRKTAEDEAAKKTQDNKSQLPTSTEQHMEVSPNAPTSQALNMSTTDPLIVGNIPLPSTTVASTAADATPLAGRQISASEAAAAAEVIAEQMVEEVLSAPGLPAPPQYADLLATTNGAFRAMPPLTQPPPPPPDIIPSAASRLQSFSDITGQVPVPLTMEIPQQATPTPAVATTVPPITSLASALSMLNTPLTGPVRIASPFAGLDVSQIQMPPMSQVPQSEPRMPPPFSTLGSMPPPMPPLPFNTVPPMASYSQDTSLPMATPMVASTAAPIVAEYTPDNPIPMVAPMAPRLIRNTATGLPEFMPNMSSLASLLLSADADSDGPVRSFLWNMRASETTVPGGERVNLVDPALTTSSEQSTGGAVRSGTESGVITPEEVSNITSSDAATVHSSGSGSPQEISAGSLLSNLASVTENAAPLSTRASSFRVSATTSSTSRVDPRHSISSSSGTPAAESSVPDGLDPSFLAALPENIRQEVIADHMRMQRIQQRTREQQSTESPGTMEVNQEFLAALPPAIQEEVLAQQRIEQERLAAQTSVQANPETPVDPASFFATLPSTLRQSVLADMDDSMVAVLPADLAAEAQGLRRELEERHRRLMQERLFTQQGSGSLSAILRHAGSLRYTLGRGPGSGAGRWRFGAGTRENAGFGSTNVKVRGRHLLDHEALTCLLVLLFVDEPKLNSGRLHRVMRNLCYHAPTRAWVVRSLLSILNRTSDTGKEKMCEADDRDKTRTPEKSKSRRGQPMQTDTASSSTSSKPEARTQGSWLSISLEAALGNRANVFQIQRTGGKKHLSTGHTHVNIHPQASPVVCRHVLDALISLAKIFPQQFLPTKAKEVQTCDSEVKEKDVDKTKAQPVTADGTASPRGKALERRDSRSEQRDTDFWELLIRLDSMCSSKKGKGIQRTHSNFSENDLGFKDYDSSPLGQLMAMLSHPVIKRSQLLTDRLLRLLGLVSTGLSDAARTQNPISTADNIAITLNRGTPTVAVSRIAVPTGQSVLIPSRPVPTSVTPAAPPSSVTSTGVNTAVSTPDEGTSVDPPPLDKDTGEKKEPEVKPEEEEDVAILETQLSMAVQVLTSKSCSEEGLEDATNLLLQLSWANNATRSAVLQLLLSGAQTLGITVSQHIRSLLGELQAFSNKRSPDAAQDEDKSMEAASTSQGDKGLLHDRFSGGSVIVTAPKKVKGGRELQLPSMTLLTSKVSSQQFFLRILKVIIQLRDAARNAKKKNKPGSLGLTTTGSRDFRRRHIGEAMAMLEAEADAIMQLVTRHDNERNADNTGQENEAANPPDTPDLPPVVPAVQPAVDQGEGAASSTGTTPGPASQESPMETDKAGTSVDEPTGEEEVQLPRLSDQLALEELWQVLGDCLSELDKTPDHHAVLILQPAVEAFFMVHAGEKEKKKGESRPSKREDQLAHLNMDLAPASPQPSSSDNPILSRENSLQSSIAGQGPDSMKFLKFAETHRTVLNQILRQSTTPLSDGPFSVLVDHTRILDFDVKRRYFRHELERLDEGIRREDLAVHVRRENVFEDSFRELFRRSADEWKHRFYIVFEGEDGQDAGGLLREWYIIIAREIFNPMYALFATSPGDRVTYLISQSSHCNSNHLSYFKFVGRIIAKAIYDNKLLDCYFTRSFYKHIIGQYVKYTDMESEDYSFYQGLVFLLEHNVKDLGYDLMFSTEIQEFGVNQTRDLVANGRDIFVTEENKHEYVKYVCQMKMTGAIRIQLNAFMEGFYDIIPKNLISIFNEQELELLISGLPVIDIDDLKTNTEYHKYQPTSLQVLWFWRALRSFDQADRARFLQFVTGTSKVPLQGFAHLEGMNGTQKFQIHRDDRSTDRLPAAHTCFNQLDLPAYETYDKLRHMLLLAINECSEGFGLA